ncbi:MAG TPA: glycerol-3-phosphate responsive antiterminator [Syntrophorhabdales bacterium]|nr:glycerol-3-phosphate responsive antiterminator [Syntrophorhabdales bacterium]
MDWMTTLRENPVIAAFRSVESVRLHDLNQVRVIFVLGGTIFDLPRLVEEAKESGKLLFVDIDLLKGIGKDAPGVRFLAKESHVDGIITTRSNLVKSAQKEGLVAVQRLFVLDSESLVGGLGVVEKSAPDAVEVLPGLILPKITQRIRMATTIPIIAGGLITEEHEVRRILDAGALGISTTSSRLFAMAVNRAAGRPANAGSRSPAHISTEKT